MAVQAIKSEWYLVLDDSHASIRLASGSALALDEQGEVTFDAVDASFAVVFDIADDGVWMTPLAGTVLIDGASVKTTAAVTNNSELQLGAVRFRISNSLRVSNSPSLVALPTVLNYEPTGEQSEVAVVLTESANDSLLQQTPRATTQAVAAPQGLLLAERLKQNYGLVGLAVGALFVGVVFWMLAAPDSSVAAPVATQAVVTAQKAEFAPVSESFVRVEEVTPTLMNTKPTPAQTPQILEVAEVSPTPERESRLPAENSSALDAPIILEPAVTKPLAVAINAMPDTREFSRQLSIGDQMAQAQRALREGDAQLALTRLNKVLHAHPGHAGARGLREQLLYILAEVPDL